MTRKKRLFCSIILISLIIPSFFTGCITKRTTFDYNGIERSYLLHFPNSYDESELYPLVVVFHGGGGNAESIEDVTNFSKKADEEDFIVVYPEGTGSFSQYKFLTWNCGFCCGYALENNIDDVGYINALIKYLLETYEINSSMIYATGISNGGIMAYRVGAELSHIFAAIGPVAAQIGGQATAEEKIWRIPKPSNPVSIIAFNGMNDSRVPYEGGKGYSNVYQWMGTNTSISFWVEQNQCNESFKRNISESGNIIIDTYNEGKNKTDVSIVTIINGTHSWPGGKKGWEKGPEPIKDISATDMIWEFFKTHSKN